MIYIRIKGGSNLKSILLTIACSLRFRSSAVMARLVWAEDQARVGMYIAAGLNRLQCNQTCRQFQAYQPWWLDRCNPHFTSLRPPRQLFMHTHVPPPLPGSAAIASSNLLVLQGLAHACLPVPHALRMPSVDHRLASLHGLQEHS